MPFADDRWLSFCALCGGAPDTRDHVPPRIFLDRPHPEDPPRIVGACLRCNRGASRDEEYVACLIEVAAQGSIDPTKLQREKIIRTLARRPAIAARLAPSLGTGRFVIQREDHLRISRVLSKIGRTLWAFETAETALSYRPGIRYAPIGQLTQRDIQHFRELRGDNIFPEIGSRTMMRLQLNESGQVQNSWQDVQAGRFSYAVELMNSSGRVKMIFSDFLYAEVDLRGEDTPAANSVFFA